MNTQDFITELKSDERLKLTNFAIDRLNSMLSKIDTTKPEDNGLLEAIVLGLNRSERARIYTGDFFKIVEHCLKAQAAFNATQAKIKNFKGSRYEELELLKEHFYKIRASELDLGFLLQGGNDEER